MNPSIRFGLELYDNPKLEKIGESIGVDGWIIADMWNRLQLFTRKYNPTGNIGEHSNEYLEKKIKCTIPGVIQAFREIGWISEDGWVKDFHLWGGADLWYQVTNYSSRYPEHEEFHRYYKVFARHQNTTRLPPANPPVLSCIVLSGSIDTKHKNIPSTPSAEVVENGSQAVFSGELKELLEVYCRKNPKTARISKMIDRVELHISRWLERKEKTAKEIYQLIKDAPAEALPWELEEKFDPDDWDEEEFFKDGKRWVTNYKGLGLPLRVASYYKPHKRGEKI